MAVEGRRDEEGAGGAGGCIPEVFANTGKTGTGGPGRAWSVEEMAVTVGRPLGGGRGQAQGRWLQVREWHSAWGGPELEQPGACGVSESQPPACRVGRGSPSVVRMESRGVDEVHAGVRRDRLGPSCRGQGRGKRATRPGNGSLEKEGLTKQAWSPGSTKSKTKCHPTPLWGPSLNWPPGPNLSPCGEAPAPRSSPSGPREPGSVPKVAGAPLLTASPPGRVGLPDALVGPTLGTEGLLPPIPVTPAVPWFPPPPPPIPAKGQSLEDLGVNVTGRLRTTDVLWQL